MTVVKTFVAWTHKFADVSLPLVHTVDALWDQSSQRPVMQVTALKNTILTGICKKVFYLLPYALNTHEKL